MLILTRITESADGLSESCWIVSKLAEHSHSATGERTVEEKSELAFHAHPKGSRILLVDDELDTLELISFNLIDAGLDVSIAVNGGEALYKVKSIAPHLIVLDVNLPDINGFEICQRLRSDSATRELPVVFLTARSNEADRVRGFELGANDYVTKPFSPRELLLRVRNLLTASVPESNENVFRAGNLCIDLAAHSVYVAGELVPLTLTEFRLLARLAEQNGRVQSREGLLAHVWQGEKGVDPRTVDTHMARLREKLGRASTLVDTVYGVGYRFVGS
jgi:two-component system, OmpR family, phosphate regulon response regulator PhoB